MRVSTAAIVIFLATVGVSAAQDASAATRRKPTNIPAQPLVAALQVLAKERNLQVIYRADLAQNVHSAGAVGEFTPKEALDRLVAGTGLTYRYLNETTVTIEQIATVEVPGNSTPPAPSDDAVSDRFRLAQSSPRESAGHGASEQTVAPKSKPSTEGNVEEIIVTATRRAQNIQDVPISIAAITSDEIDRRNLVSAEDYLRSVPGVNQVSEQGSTTIVIRGVTSSPSQENFASGPTVATYFGETPTTNSAGLAGGANIDIKLVDIERVEVLRGPQGTSFGDSSLGGAVRTIPVAPKLNSIEANVAANYSHTAGTGGNNEMVQGVLNLPLISDQLAIRAVGYQFVDSGFYRTVSGSDPAFQALAASYGVPNLAVDKDHVGGTRFAGGRVAALWQPMDDLKLTLTYLHQRISVDGSPFASQGTYDNAVFQAPAPHPPIGADKSLDLANLLFEYDFGWAGLLTSMSYIDSSSMDSTANRTFGLAAGAAADRSSHREYSGDMRLTSQFAGPWKLLAGLYVQDLKDAADYSFYWLGSPAKNPFFPRTSSIGTYDDDRDLKQRSLYGEVSYEFLHGFTLTGGVRAYNYKRTGEVTPTGLLGNLPTNVHIDKSGTSSKGTLSYEFNDTAMVYGTWAQGFRLGKAQPGLPAAICGTNGIVTGTDVTIASTKTVNSDTVENTEIGTKLTLLDRRLTFDADLYRIKWKGVPVTTIAPCGLSYVANAGGAISKGTELQAEYRATSALRLDVGASIVDATLTTAVPALHAVSGARLPGSPKFNANAAIQYDFALAGHAASVRTDWYYLGQFFGDVAEDLNTEVRAYGRLDISGRMLFGNLSVELFAHNVTDADNYTWRGIAGNRGNDFGYRLRPRTIGIQAGYHL